MFEFTVLLSLLEKIVFHLPWLCVQTFSYTRYIFFAALHSVGVKYKVEWSGMCMHRMLPLMGSSQAYNWGHSLQTDTSVSRLVLYLLSFFVK